MLSPAEVSKPLSRWPAKLIQLLVCVLGLRVVIELLTPAFFIAVWWGFFEWNHPAPSVPRQFAAPLMLFGFRSAVKRGLLPAAALLTLVDIVVTWRFWRILIFVSFSSFADYASFVDYALAAFPLGCIAVDCLGVWAMWHMRGQKTGEDLLVGP